MNPAATDIQTRLVANSIGSDPTSATTWPIYVSQLPETDEDCIAIFDLDPDATEYSTGNPVYNSKVQIVVRSTSYATGFSKVVAILGNLEQAHSFTYDSMNYLGCSVSSGPTPLGVDYTGRNIWSTTFRVPRQHT